MIATLLTTLTVLMEWLRPAAKACVALYRRPMVSTGIVLVVVVAAAAWMARCRSGRLSPALEARVEAHTVETRAETTIVNTAVRAARSDSAEAAHVIAASAPHERKAAKDGERADSLALTADWRDAYEVRTAQVSELLSVDSLKDRAVLATSRADEELTAAVHVSLLRADRADSLVSELARAVEENGACRLRCWATRIAIGGALGGTLMVARALARR